MTTAQLAVQRSGQLDWLRRAARQLWTITGDGNGGWRAPPVIEDAPDGSWLCAAPDGTSVLAQAEPSSTSILAALRHPRSGAWFLAEPAALVDSVRGLRHPLAAAAMTLSADSHRLYALTAGGELYRLTASAHREIHGEPVLDAPELLLGGLAEHGAPSGLTLGPAGLVLATERAVVGINLRSLRVAPILADLAAHPLLAELRAPAVAMDHRRNLYLADEALVVCAPAYETPPVLCARAA